MKVPRITRVEVHRRKRFDVALRMNFDPSAPGSWPNIVDEIARLPVEEGRRKIREMMLASPPAVRKM